MHFPKIVMAAALLSSIGVAQYNEYELYPGQTDFTSRGNSVWDKAGETLQGIHASHHRGLGDTGKGCEIHGFAGNLQDQNLTTQEMFHWTVRRGTDQTGPATGANDVVARIGPMITPYGGSSPAAFSVATNLSVPIKLDCTSFFAYGLKLGPAPAWPNDGMSTHISVMSPPNNPTQQSHPRAEDHAWELALGATTSVHPSSKRTWRYRLRVKAPLLQNCNGGTVCGMGGLFPLPNNALGFRTRWGRGMAGGTSMVYLGTSRTPGINFAPEGPRLFIGGFTLALGGATIAANGNVYHNVISSLPSGLANSGTVHIQAVAVKGPFVYLTNVESITP